MQSVPEFPDLGAEFEFGMGRLHVLLMHKVLYARLYISLRAQLTIIICFGIIRLDIVAFVLDIGGFLVVSRSVFVET